MIKVVGLDDSLVKQISCKNCASILEYTNKEVDSTTWMDYSVGKSSGKETITCPVCQTKVLIRSW